MRKLFIAIVLSLTLAHTAHSQGTLLFFDEFQDNRNDWPILNSDIAVTDIRDGYYFLQHLRTQKALSVKKHVPIDESRDYMIIAELEKFDLNGDPGYGILWGRDDEDNEYNFLISGKGNFKIFRMNKGHIQKLIDWYPSKYINRDNTVNRLTIKKVGESMYFYANSHLLAKTKIMPFYNDLIGIKVFHNQKIGVRSFYVYQR
ncbi:MAG: hypothetical protein RIS47_454 [Bacteroidota bacterium]|jgi:hypothetical protein